MKIRTFAKWYLVLLSASVLATMALMWTDPRATTTSASGAITLVWDARLLSVKLLKTFDYALQLVLYRLVYKVAVILLDKYGLD